MNQSAAIWYPASELIPWEQNYLQHPQAQIDEIKRSIRRNGWGSACVAQAHTNRLIIGHGRLAAFLQLLEAEDELSELEAMDPADAELLVQGLVPVRFRDVPDDRAAELAIADNEAARMALRDDDRLVAVIRGIVNDDDDLAHIALGMHDDDVRALLADPVDPRTVPVPAIPSPRGEPDSKVGEVYELGPHRLLCGDSMDAVNLAALMQGERAAAVVQDPPFAIYGSSTGVSSSVADDAMIQPFFRQMWHAVENALKLFGHAYVFCDWRSYPTLWNAMKGGNLKASNCLVWDKGGGGLGSKWQSCHELALFVELIPEQGTMSGKKSGCRLVLGKSNILRHARPRGEERQHNAAKPRELVAEIIEASTDPGDLVVDLFGGSGTTLLVAAQTGRLCRMAELLPLQADAIRMRWTAWAEAANIDPGAGALRP